MNLSNFEEKSGVYRTKDTIRPPVGSVHLRLENVVTGKIIEDLVKNVFVTTGKNAIAQRLSGQDKGQITYCALGTGTDAPVEADTDLQTEIFRKIISVRSVSGNIATLQTFFNTSEANDTLREAGLFGDGATLTTDSGILFARTAINRTKTSSDTLTVTWTVTIG